MSFLRIGVALLMLAVAIAEATAATARINKVLPHFLDQKGRHTLSPSLYERDAYQLHLRQHPKERLAVRFDVNWKASGVGSESLRLRLELRGSAGDAAKPLVLETPVEPSKYFSKWSSLKLKGEDYKNFGDLIAWHATLWDGDILIAEQKSFLW